MIKEAIATAATRDEAIQKAKLALNAPLDADVKFEIIQDAQKAFLGIFGGKEAKVRAYYEAPDEAAPVKAAAPKAAPAPKAAKAEAKKSEINPEDDAAIRNYLTTIIKGMGIEDITLTSHEEEEETVYELITNESHGALIGRHGETLDAVQYLVRLFANKNTQGKKKVSLNVGDYREKRAENLKEFAARSAAQVLKYGRNVKLDPMNPYERRIIHTAIQAIEGVTSHSVGYDSERRVIITLEEGVQPTHGDRRRGGYNKGGRGGYNNRGRGGNRGGKPAYKPEVSADRAPRSDVAGSSRYGKIEIRKSNEE
jgi:spoIIIJ-associated protein